MKNTQSKSIFVSLLIIGSALFMLIAIVQMVRTSFGLSWLGLFISCFPIVYYFLSLSRLKKARTSPWLTNITAPVFVGSVVATLGTFQVGGNAWWVAFIAMVMLVAWLRYVNWYSRLERPLNPRLVVGRKFPSHTFRDAQGNKISTSTLDGQKVMYMFYRGNWCPFCMAQIREVVASYQELADRGVRILLISPQSQEHTAELAQKFEVPMQFLVDKDNQVARSLGIAHENGVPKIVEPMGYESETVLPTVIITNEDGRIIYVNMTDNYRIRPEPAEYIRVIDGLSERLETDAEPRRSIGD